MRHEILTELSDEGAASKDALDLFDSDILALGELDQVLDTVDDTESSFGVDFCDIAGLQPAVGVDGLARLLLVLVVARENGVATHEQLATRVRLV